ncbi:MAG: glucosylceramidase [Bacteroidetes bacterium]|nr:glucosylceramidase [Bacteroidota bacterium]
MNRAVKQKSLIINILMIISSSLPAQTDGKTVKIFTSAIDSKEMLAAQENIIFQHDPETENLLINIYPEFRYQKVLGFGAAFTETSAYNFSLLPPDRQQQLAEAYFGKNGIGYNFCRTHINACDFSIDEYTYVDEGDVDLRTFSINRDKKYIIPLIKAARTVNPDLWLFASPWSPPAWMKDNKRVTGGGRLLPEFYPVWARYVARYVEEYQKEDIDFFAVTIQNEPKAVQPWESCIWTGKEEGEFATYFLRPALDQNGFESLKIMVWDHNKERIMERAKESMSVPGANKAIWGLAFHWYSGDHFDNLRLTHELYPDMPLIATENNSAGVRGGGVAECWEAIEKYAKETIMNFNNFMAANVDWNLMVDVKTGGPFHNTNAGGSSSAAVFVNTDHKEFILGPLYYTNGHFSKFIQRGAYRIGSSSYSDAVKVAAFCNPNGEIVVIVLNTTDENATPKIRLNHCTAPLFMPAKSLQTLIISTD